MHELTIATDDTTNTTPYNDFDDAFRALMSHVIAEDLYLHAKWPTPHNHRVQAGPPRRSGPPIAHRRNRNHRPVNRQTRCRTVLFSRRRVALDRREHQHLEIRMRHRPRRATPWPC